LPTFVQNTAEKACLSL